MELQEIIKAVQAELPNLSDSEIIDMIDAAGVDAEFYTPAHVTSLIKSVGQSGNAIVPTDNAAISSQPAQAPAKVENQSKAELQKVETGDVAPANPTTIAKIAPPPSVQDALVSRLQSQFEQGAAIARLEVEAMTAGHDVTMAQGLSALLRRNIDPLANLGEIELPTVDWDAPYQLPNPFAEVKS